MDTTAADEKLVLKIPPIDISQCDGGNESIQDLCKKWDSSMQQVLMAIDLFLLIYLTSKL